MFLHLSVSHSVHRGVVCPIACWDTPPGPEAGTPPLIHDTPLQRSAYWEVRATSRRYASYWNAVLFSNTCRNYMKISHNKNVIQEP